VLREGLSVAGAGIVAGVGGACLLTRSLATLLFGVHAIEPLTLKAGSVRVASVSARFRDWQ